MALIAYPGCDFGWTWRELGLRHALAYFLFRDPGVFTANLHAVSDLPAGVLEGPSDDEAMLWCFANDARAYYENNTGSVTLEVTRLR
jgi:hypothetical protein